MICSDCEQQIHVCDKCGEPFRVEVILGTEEIICHDGKHYHSICKVKGFVQGK